MKRHTLSAQELCDLELLLDGSFNPLTGFMNYDDYTSCLQSCRLTSGEVWPIPITLTTKEIHEIGTSLALCQIDGPVVATLRVESTWKIDVKQECLLIYKTLDISHPGVEAVQLREGMHYVGGSIISSGSIKHYDFMDLRLSPAEVKTKISKWKRVVAFHTRNPMHNSHLKLIKNAALSVGAGILIHPTVGITQSSDIDYWTRVKCYKKLLASSLPAESYILSIIPLSMRMAGPREALLHAIVRRNYGCTHFVMGRDPAGPSTRRTDNNKPFYDKYEAHDLAAQFTQKELGIEIIKAQELSYNPVYQDYTEADMGTLSISGTELRRLIHSKEPVPEWFTTPEVVNILSETVGGCCIYLIGLSGSGKTTLARALAERLREALPSNKVLILDGDEIRRNLSAGLGFSREDRSINVRRIGYVADLLTKSGNIVICANIAPYEEDRKWNRELMGGRYLEVYLNTTLAVCEDRDCKGLYKAARDGKLKQFTGISDVFEEPQNPDIVLDTNVTSVEACMKEILIKVCLLGLI